MSYAATVLKMMIASPGDVALERAIAQEVIHQWNAINSADRRTVLLPVAWETHASPAMGERAQEIINRQLLRDCDLLVAMFWTRIGTPTGGSPSGTVEEIRELIQAGKPVMLYFSVAPVRLDFVDTAQSEALKQFKSECRAQGLVEEYESHDEFRRKFARQLAQTIIQRFPATPIASDLPQSSGNAPGETTGSTAVDAAALAKRPLSLEERDLLASLPDEARELLTAAGQDPHGAVLVTRAFEGLAVTTNERQFARGGEPRDEARWKRAVRDLVRLGLLDQADSDGQVFSVTDEGYRAVDLLSRLGPA